MSRTAGYPLLPASRRLLHTKSINSVLFRQQQKINFNAIPNNRDNKKCGSIAEGKPDLLPTRGINSNRTINRVKAMLGEGKPRALTCHTVE
jgi:hypothetical protein